MSKTITVKAYPYAEVYGTIDVPDDIDDLDVPDYVTENWNKIDFLPPDYLDFEGCSFEVEVSGNDSGMGDWLPMSERS